MGCQRPDGWLIAAPEKQIQRIQMSIDTVQKIVDLGKKLTVALIDERALCRPGAAIVVTFVERST